MEAILWNGTSSINALRGCTDVTVLLVVSEDASASLSSAGHASWVISAVMVV